MEENSREVKRRRKGCLVKEVLFLEEQAGRSPRVLKMEAASRRQEAGQGAERSCAAGLGLLSPLSIWSGGVCLPGVSGGLGGSEQNILYVQTGRM